MGYWYYQVETMGPEESMCTEIIEGEGVKDSFRNLTHIRQKKKGGQPARGHRKEVTGEVEGKLKYEEETNTMNQIKKGKRYNCHFHPQMSGCLL